MFGSMCLMMVLNVVFLKILLSAISVIPTGPTIIPWLIFVVAIAKVARKIDDIVARIGLSTARTGDPLGKGLPGMLAMMVAKNVVGNVSKSIGANTKFHPTAASSKAGYAQSQQPTHSNIKSHSNNATNNSLQSNFSQPVSQNLVSNLSSTQVNAPTNSQVGASIGGAVASTLISSNVQNQATPNRQPTQGSSTSNKQEILNEVKQTPSRPPIGRNDVKLTQETPISPSRNGAIAPPIMNSNSSSTHNTSTSPGRNGVATPPIVNNNSSSTYNISTNPSRNGATVLPIVNNNSNPTQNVLPNPTKNGVVNSQQPTTPKRPPIGASRGRQGGEKSEINR